MPLVCLDGPHMFGHCKLQSFFHTYTILTYTAIFTYLHYSICTSIIKEIKLFRSEYIAKYSINNGPYKMNMFAQENFAYTFCRQLINVINSKPPPEVNKDVLMPKYNKILLDNTVIHCIQLFK